MKKIIYRTSHQSLAEHKGNDFNIDKAHFGWTDAGDLMQCWQLQPHREDHEYHKGTKGGFLLFFGSYFLFVQNNILPESIREVE